MISQGKLIEGMLNDYIDLENSIKNLELDIEELENDSIVLNCNEKAKAGTIVECDVFLNSMTVITNGISAKYAFSSGIEYIDFTLSDLFDDYKDVNFTDSKGFVLIASNITGVENIGTLTFKIPNTALPNEIYKIELKEAVIGDGEDKEITLDNANATIRILSDVNTLDNIEISLGELNETFDKEKNNYTANVNSSKVNIIVDKTDENSFVDGDGEIELEYGNNEVKIIVTSEDGKENVYIINIFRDYEFSSDVYIYNKEDKYIYTGTVVNEDVILDNIELPEGYDKKIDSENSKLIIMNGHEIETELNILNINFMDYDVNGDTLFIQKDLSYDEFISRIVKSDKLKIKVFNSDVEVTDGNIEQGMVLKVYDMKDSELDKFDIGIHMIDFDPELSVDEENYYIKYLLVGTTGEELLEKITVTNSDIKIFNKDGNEKEHSDKLSTGDVVVIYFNEMLTLEYTISIIGDSNGDGVIDLIDLAQMRKHIVGWVNPNTGEIQIKEGVYYYALDFNEDGMVDLVDLVRMRKTIVSMIG